MARQFVSKKGLVTVMTDKGCVRGYELDHIRIFKGVPYAKAERFHPPVPADPWEGELDCTSFGITSPQQFWNKPQGELYVPHRFWVSGEDCLNLNVWTPGTDDKKRPVMVWFHGGGYAYGTAIDHLAYEGENMSREGDAVVVTVNHRLNIFGYFDLSAYGDEYENSGNLGTEDLIAALKWIKNNIESFGGDPGNVTIFGQSGGGGKVTCILQSPEADGLYHKCISMSGSKDFAKMEMMGQRDVLPERLMEACGVSTIKELEKVPWEHLLEHYRVIGPELARQGIYSGGWPTVNSHYRGDPHLHGFRKETMDIPVIACSCFADMTPFADTDLEGMAGGDKEEFLREVFGEEAADKMIPLFRKAFPERDIIDLLRMDEAVRPDASEYIRLRGEGGGRNYCCIFNADMPIDGRRVPWHCADIPFVFHNTEFAPYAQKEGFTEELESIVFDTVMAFARTGDPNNARIPNWEPSTTEHEHTLVIGLEPEVRTDMDKELLKIFHEAMPKAIEKIGKAKELASRH